MSVEHGGARDAELRALGLDPADVLDLSANLHPYGAHPDVLRAAATADPRRYPDPQAEGLRDAIAARAGLAPDQVLVTAGATAALHLAARALLGPGDAAALFPPAFGEYEAAVRTGGGRAAEYRAAPPAFAPDLQVRPAALGFWGNPNNPSGRYLARDAVEALARRLGGILVLDVAYAPFVEDAWDADGLVREGADVLVVHSLTKLHAIPGLRVGYVTGPAELIGRLAAIQPSWPVGAPAIAAARVALATEEEQLARAANLPALRTALVRTLQEARLSVHEGRANFVLARAAPRFPDGEALRLALLRRGVVVRDCRSFGLPDWVRVAVPDPAGGERLRAALAGRG